MKSSYRSSPKAFLAALVGCLTSTCASAAPAPAAAAANQQAAASPGVFARLAIIQSRMQQNKIDEETGKAIQDVLKLAPDNAQAHWVAAKYYQKLGLTDLSEKEYDTVDKLDPKQPDAVMADFASKLEHDDIGGAMQDYEYVRQRFPDDPTIMLMEARRAEAQGKQKDADFYLERAMEVAPIRVGVATAAGELRLRQGRPKAALDLALQDLAKKPDSYRSNYVAGRACMDLRRYEEGKRYLLKAFSLNPKDPIYDAAYAGCFSRAHMYGDAIEPSMLFMAQCTQQNELGLAKKKLVEILSHVTQTDADNAAAAADRVLGASPWKPRFQLALADVYDQMGWYKLAEKHYLAGINLDPHIGRAYYRLGQDRQRDQQLGEALVLYKLAYDRDRNDMQIKLGLYRLSERALNYKNDLACQIKDWFHRRPEQPAQPQQPARDASQYHARP